MILDGMPNDPIQGQGHRGLKVAKMIDLLRWYRHIIKRLMVNYDAPRQYLNFDWTFYDSFDIHHPVILKLRVFHLWQTNFASYVESAGSPVRSLFICSCGLSTVFTGFSNDLNVLMFCIELKTMTGPCKHASFSDI